MAVLIRAAVQEFSGIHIPSLAKIMDFGCGKGKLVQALQDLGFDSYGCDIRDFWSLENLPVHGKLKTIPTDRYRIPFESDSFDVVVSTSVLEHAQNTEECFREIHRILKPGGYAMHHYPGKWYLPFEPHIYVPLVNYFWPRCSKGWLRFWALLGVRNEYQLEQPWRAVADANQKYCREGLSYLSTRQYQKLSWKVFGNCRWPMEFYLEHAYGGFARLSKKLPFRKLSGIISREFRMGFMIQHKPARPSAPGGMTSSRR